MDERNKIEEVKQAIADFFALEEVMYCFPRNNIIDKCIIFLPGRGISARETMHWAKIMEANNALLVVPQTYGNAWYPAPNGVEDQFYALLGIENAVAITNRLADSVCKCHQLNKSQIVIMGFSAGAVTALATATTSKEPFAAVISYAGAILEPKNLPKCKHPEMPVLLRHNQDDNCFFWDERYVPMLNVLKKQGYNVSQIERRFGGHQPHEFDLKMFGKFISNQVFNE